jgi:O-antigen biosynthesis protein WbqP
MISMYNSELILVKIAEKRIFHIIKRIIDLVFALNLLVFLLPALLILTLLVKLSSKGPVIFKQRRMGKDNKVFYIYKFRTMYVGTPNKAKKHCDVKCITKIGKFLRKTSLDELPQLVNIIKGDMSFVGYRPLILDEADIHEYRNQFQVYKIKPGITGYAQINGRDLIEPYDKAKYDYHYLINRSFWFDIKILFLTFIKVLKRESIHDGAYMNEKETNDKTA